MPELVGQTLRGRYSIAREIGRGGMGAVYEAVQLDLGRRVAVKVLLGAEERALRRFRQEAMASASIQHPNVVNVTDFDSGDAGSPPFIVMELLQGRSLASYLAEHRQIAPARAVLIAAQILDGLGAAHAAGIIHRDVKPGNVFLVDIAGGQFVKVLDFGIAKLLEDDHGVRTTVGSLVGTPAYVAPEQVLAGVIDARTDIHAVGLCLYEMLVGSRAFDAPDTMTLLGQIVRTEAPPIRVPGIPGGLAAVVKRGLEKDKDLRFATTSAMLDALRPFFPGSSSVSMTLSVTGVPTTVPDLATAAGAGPTSTSRSPFTVPASTLGPSSQGNEPQRLAAPGFTNMPATMVSPARDSAPGARMPSMGPGALPAAPSRSGLTIGLLLGLGLGLVAVIGLVAVGLFVVASRSSEGSKPNVQDAGAEPALATGPVDAAAGPAASISARAKSTAVLPPTRTTSATPTATTSGPTPAAGGSTVRLATVLNIDRARADAWFQQNEPALRASCLRTRTCFRIVTMPAEGAGGVSVVQPAQPAGCDRSTADCIGSFVATHPYPAPACRDAGGCRSSMTFSFD